MRIRLDADLAQTSKIVDIPTSGGGCSRVGGCGDRRSPSEEVAIRGWESRKSGKIDKTKPRSIERGETGKFPPWEKSPKGLFDSQDSQNAGIECHVLLYPTGLQNYRNLSGRVFDSTGKTKEFYHEV